MISFAEPAWLFLLLLIPVWLLGLRRPGLAPPSLRFSGAPWLAPFSGTGRARLLPWLRAAQAAALVLMILAMARPQRVVVEEEEAAPGRDLYLILDVSSSMADPVWEGGRPIDAAKEALARFVRARAGDRIGLITFARYPELRCPLTRDHAFLLHLIAEATCVPRGADLDGTGIGAALAEAALRVRDEDAAAQGGRDKAAGRAAVLITDGEENRHRIEPGEAARLCAAEGLKVNTVFAGGRKEKETAPDTRLHAFVAAVTGGIFAEARDAAGLDEILKEVDALERTASPPERLARRREIYRAFLGPAALLWILAFLAGRGSGRIVP